MARLQDYTRKHYMVTFLVSAIMYVGTISSRILRKQNVCIPRLRVLINIH